MRILGQAHEREVKRESLFLYPKLGSDLGKLVLLLSSFMSHSVVHSVDTNYTILVVAPSSILGSSFIVLQLNFFYS